MRHLTMVGLMSLAAVCGDVRSVPMRHVLLALVLGLASSFLD